MLGAFEAALDLLSEALELADRHQLVGDAWSAADLIFSVHCEREDLSTAQVWIDRGAVLAPRVGARYAQVSHALNGAMLELLRGDPENATRCIESLSEQYRNDPIVRQRMLYLSIHTRIAASRGDRTRVAALAPALRIALDLRRSTGPHDFHVASYALALDAIGARSAAEEYVATFIASARRDHTPPSPELRVYLSSTGK
jgi:tetratricopeptide (TPR) repeat protein